MTILYWFIGGVCLVALVLVGGFLHTLWRGKIWRTDK